MLGLIFIQIEALLILLVEEKKDESQKKLNV